MIRHLFFLYLSTLLFFPVVHAQEAAPLSEQGAMEHLFSQIGHGEVLYRDDIIHDALKRLYRIAPDHPRGILAEVRLAVRLGDDGEAQKQLERLHRVAPESDEYKDAALLVELSSSESSEVLAQARLLSMVGRYDEARQHYDTLLQGRYPTPELAQEYWQMRVNQEGDHQTAIAQLSTSLARFPNHPALLRALVTFHFAVEEPDQAYAYLGVLARNRNERDWAADREYEYLNSLPVSEHSHDLWADYLIRYAGLQSMTDRAQGKLNHYQALLNDPDWRAGQEGINLVEREQHPARALLLLEQALQSYPDDVEVIGSAGLAALRLGRRQQALQYFDRAIETERHDDRKSRWMSLKNATELWLLLERASHAEAQQQWQEAERLYQQAYRQDTTNIFAMVGLARAYAGQGDADTAWSYYQKAATMAPTDETAQRAVIAHADAHAPQQARELLRQLPASMQASTLISQADTRYQLAILQEEIDEAEASEDYAHAIALLKQAQGLAPEDPWLSYRLAAMLRDQGEVDAAFRAFSVHLQDHDGEPATQYAHALLLASVQRWAEARDALEQIPADALTEPMHALAQRVHENEVLDRAQALYDAGDTRAAMAALKAEPELTAGQLRLAEWSAEQGDARQAVRYYRQVLEQEGTLAANDYRGLARAWLASDQDPQQALDWYAQAMVDIELLPGKALQPSRDDVAFTRAMRPDEQDDWLRRGLRADAHELYEQQNPTIHLHNDTWWRSDGTPGLSRLKANTTMLQIEYPIKRGKGFIRADHVRMDAGRLRRDQTGVYRGEFGTCGAGASGCRHGLKQTATGTSLAAGWQGQRLNFDVGVTPQGFAVTNWTGGLSYTGNIRQLGWRLTASRRPMSNSLLSFAGARDPRTGKKWGGVMATGGALSLSWDQGEANGVWADISHHRLSGKNVSTNHRTRFMGGYYRRLINKNNEVLSAGINLMHWKYKKEMGDFHFDQGGYYSPRRYQSVSLPIRYARRTANWSFVVQGGASFSSARNHEGGRRRGFGYTLGGVIERRLSNHLVLGAALDLQHSKDYAPSRGMLYLRYTFEPWKGSLPLGPEPLVPYADFK